MKLGLKKVLQFQGRGLKQLEGLLDLGGDGGGLPQAGLEGNRHRGGFWDWGRAEKRQKTSWPRRF